MEHNAVLANGALRVEREFQVYNTKGRKLVSNVDFVGFGRAMPQIGEGVAAVGDVQEA